MVMYVFFPLLIFYFEYNYYAYQGFGVYATSHVHAIP